MSNDQQYQSENSYFPYVYKYRVSYVSSTSKDVASKRNDHLRNLGNAPKIDIDREIHRDLMRNARVIRIKAARKRNQQVLPVTIRYD